MATTRTSFRRTRRRFLNLLLTSVLLLGFAALPQNQLDAGENHTLEIHLGEIDVFPNELFARVPIFVTSTEDITGFQMGLEYEDLLLVEADPDNDIHPLDVVGTLGETAGHVYDLTLPGDPEDPEFTELSVTYSNSIDAGENLLVGYLVFDLETGTLPTVTETIPITIVESLSYPATIYNDSDITDPADTFDGSIQFFFGNTIKVGTGVGTSYGTIIPIIIYTPTDTSTLQIGLEYEDLLCNHLDLCDSHLEAFADDCDADEVADLGLDDDVSIIISENSDGVEVITVTLSGDAVIEGGEPVTLLSLVVGQDLAADSEGEIPAPPKAGLFEVSLVAEETLVEDESLSASNLVDGYAEIQNHFIRGDTNHNEGISLADVMVILQHVTDSGPDVYCEDSADVNDDGALSILDGILLLDFIFREGPEPDAPFPNTGPDTGDDDLDCI